MNLLDRLIAAVSPSWGAQRGLARVALAQLRAYDGAKRGDPRTDGWVTPGSGANAELGTSASTLRNRGRDLVRNNPYASRAVRILATKTIGTGITPRLMLPDDQQARRDVLRDAWADFADHADPAGQLDFYGLQLQVARAMFESGECLVRFLPRPSRFGMRVPLQLQVLEPDYLDTARTQALENGGAIVQGVEFDRDARRVAYWLFREHPGEQVFNVRRGLQAERVPAAEVLHIFEPLRPGQARGVPMFAPAVLRLRMIDDYQDAEMRRKIIAASFAAFVKTPKKDIQAVVGQGTTPAGRRAPELTLAGGRIQRLGPEEDITFQQPSGDGSYDAYMIHQLHAVAAGTGVTYAQLTGDLRQVNFSSARIGLNDFHDLLDTWQWLVLVPQLCAPVWRRVGQVLVATGERRAADPWRARWTAPRRRYLDVKTEVAAARDEVRAGLSTLFDKIAEQGEDPEEMMLERARQDALLDRLGIKVESDSRYFGQAGAGSAPADNDAADDDDEEPADDAADPEKDQQNA